MRRSVIRKGIFANEAEADEVFPAAAADELGEFLRLCSSWRGWENASDDDDSDGGVDVEGKSVNLRCGAHCDGSQLKNEDFGRRFELLA